MSNLPHDVLIEVTPEDIRHGKPQDATSCPIALALRRYGLEDPCVEHDSISANWKGAFYVYSIPNTALQFVNDFDRRRPVAPFSFALVLRD